MPGSHQVRRWVSPLNRMNEVVAELGGDIPLVCEISSQAELRLAPCFILGEGLPGAALLAKFLDPIAILTL